MNRRFSIDPVTHARVLADRAEQMAHEMHRTAGAVKTMDHDVRVTYDLVTSLVSPLMEILKSKWARPPAKVQVLVSTRGGR